MLVVPACGPVNASVKCLVQYLWFKSSVNFRCFFVISIRELHEIRKALLVTDFVVVRGFI